MICIRCRKGSLIVWLVFGSPCYVFSELISRKLVLINMTMSCNFSQSSVVYVAYIVAQKLF